MSYGTARVFPAVVFDTSPAYFLATFECYEVRSDILIREDALYTTPIEVLFVNIVRMGKESVFAK